MIQRTKLPLGHDIWHVGDPARLHGACEMYVHVSDCGEFCQVLMECTEFHDGTVLVSTREGVELAYESCLDSYDAYHVSRVTWRSGDTIDGLWDGGVAALQASPDDNDHTQWFTREDAFSRAEECAGLLAMCRLFGRVGGSSSSPDDLMSEVGCA